MEIKEYKRYTKALSREELRHRHQFKPNMIIEGSLSYMSHNSQFLTCSLDGVRRYFKWDEVTKFILQNFKGGTKVRAHIAYVEDYYTGQDSGWRIIRCERLKKEPIAITNQRLYTMLQHEAYVRKEQAMHKQLLHKPLSNSGEVWMLLKSVESEQYDYQLQAIDCFEYQQSTDISVEVLMKKYNITEEPDVKALRMADYRDGYLIEVPGTDLVWYRARQTTKKKRCRYCESLPDGNYSLKLEMEYIPEYFCEHCFFQEMKIQVPDEMLSEKYEVEIHKTQPIYISIPIGPK